MTPRINPALISFAVHRPLTEEGMADIAALNGLPLYINTGAPAASRSEQITAMVQRIEQLHTYVAYCRKQLEWFESRTSPICLLITSREYYRRAKADLAATEAKLAALAAQPEEL